MLKCHRANFCRLAKEYRKLILDCLSFLPRHAFIIRRKDCSQEKDVSILGIDSAYAGVHTKLATGRIEFITRWAQEKWPRELNEVEASFDETLKNLDKIASEKGVPRFRYECQRRFTGGQVLFIQGVGDAIEYLDSISTTRDLAVHQNTVLKDLLQQYEKYLMEYPGVLPWWKRHWQWLIGTIIATIIAPIITWVVIKKLGG